MIREHPASRDEIPIPRRKQVLFRVPLRVEKRDQDEDGGRYVIKKEHEEEKKDEREREEKSFHSLRQKFPRQLV